MSKPVLVVMAAGMASRYGGTKQSAPIDPEGQVILDYSVYDACRAGFGEAVFVIRESLRRDFEEHICPRMEPHIKTTLVYQSLDGLPEGYSVPEGRTKPWGTGHAVLTTREAVGDRPFAVLNADDFYGAGAFRAIHDFLVSDADPHAHAMAGYRIENTLSENGTVSRGVCETRDGMLLRCTERLGLRPADGGAADGEGRFFPAGSYVSMNFWGFKPSIFPALERDFRRFLDIKAKADPMKAECFLPDTPSGLIASGEASVAVLPTDEVWSGVTYREDMPGLQARIAALKVEGKYPEKLWG